MQSSTRSLLKQKYEGLLAKGEISVDGAQLEVLEKLQRLADWLFGYRPAAARGLLASFISPAPPPKGLYIYGSVGRGKSMLMDLFFETTYVSKKRRVHFHQFMLDVQSRLHAMQEGEAPPDGVIPQLAKDLSAEAWLLCFDEFHVSNIADAMILGRLFEALFANGVVIVATSNAPPDDLYRNGLQRERFLPFIELIKKRMSVIEIRDGTDHRYDQLKGKANYFTPLGAPATTQLQNIFFQVTGGAAAKAMELPLNGRSVSVPRAARDIAFFTFAELCSQPLSAADYLLLAECFSVIFIDGVPTLSAERRDETVRFTTLIDALYEMKTKVYVAAAGLPETLCPEGALASSFQRTASRLIEMQGEDYRKKAHLTQ